MASGFKWTENKSQAAILLADGHTQVDVAKEIGVADRTVRSWMADEEFSAEVDRLTLMMGIASRAERLRLAKRVVRQMTTADGTLITNKDLLEWMKLAQAETDGIKLDISQLAAALGADDAPVADGG
jgi:transposase-like protein